MDLVGGYYDAGDHVKFGLPMAFSLTMLSWGAIEFRKEITGLNQLGNTLWAIRWGTDYFMKAHPQPNVLWGQVRLMFTHIYRQRLFGHRPISYTTYVRAYFGWEYYRTYHRMNRS